MQTRIILLLLLTTYTNIRNTKCEVRNVIKFFDYGLLLYGYLAAQTRGAGGGCSEIWNKIGSIVYGLCLFVCSKCGKGKRLWWFCLLCFVCVCVCLCVWIWADL